jgi:hypothetical protein
MMPKEIGIVTAIQSAMPMQYYVDRGFGKDGELEDFRVGGTWVLTKHKASIGDLTFPIVVNSATYNLAALNTDMKSEGFLGVLYELPSILYVVDVVNPSRYIHTDGWIPEGNDEGG